MSGVWKDLTDNVNSMASNLTNQVRNIAEVTTAVARGDLSRKITVDVRGEILLLKETINTMVDQLNGFAAEVTRVAREVGTEGKLGGQATVTGVAGTWKDLTDSVNAMATNLTGQVRNIAEVTTAVARGDLSRKITVDVRGEILQLKETINTMVDQLNSFAAEVTRVAREVGTEGKLGGQANVKDVSGVWKDLTENVNVMANNLTEQVRGIVKVVTAVANGDLRQRLTVESKGEVAALGDTINSMTDTLAIFADQVTSVAREVGVEGRLGGQAHVAGAAGTWKDLVANVNMLAANLTTQVRAIAEVATAVTKGDLTRSIQVEARGEVSELKDNINAMIHNLRHTTERNTEQDWLKTNLAKFSAHDAGPARPGDPGQHAAGRVRAAGERAPGRHLHRRLRQTASVTSSSSPVTPTCATAPSRAATASAKASWASAPCSASACCWRASRRIPSAWARAWSKPSRAMSSCCRCCTKARSRPSSSWPRCTNSPRRTWPSSSSSPAPSAWCSTPSKPRCAPRACSSSPRNSPANCSRSRPSCSRPTRKWPPRRACWPSRTWRWNARTRKSSRPARRWKKRPRELALTSRYKTEFLANMSHELRTPLNSILILGQQLSENPENNLSARQVEFAKTIHGAGTDLLNLISDILDLSKIESGTVTVESEELAFSQLRETIERNFRHEAESRHLTFTTDFDPRLGRTMVTDAKRLMQIVKNLLSNAMKFTAQGSVRLHVGPAMLGWSRRSPGAVAGQAGGRILGHRHRHRHLAREAEDHLRGLPAGRRRHGAQVRRHRPGAGHQPRAGAPAGRRDPPQERARGRAAPSRSIYRWPTRARPMAAAPRRLTPGRLRRPRCQLLPAPPVERVEDDRDSHRPTASNRCSSSRTTAPTRACCSRPRTARASRRWWRTTAPRPCRWRASTSSAAVTLDVFLPDMLGWTVLNQLKHDPATRHIPVQVLTVEEERQYGLERGAFSFMTKPTSTEGLASVFERIQDFIAPRVRELLVVEDDAAEQMSIEALIGGDDIRITQRRQRRRGAGAAARAQVRLRDPRPEAAGHLRLRAADRRSSATSGCATCPSSCSPDASCRADEEGELRRRAKSIVLKGVQSPERLLDETALFLHREVAELPEAKQRMLEKLHDSDEPLRERKVLVVDDDVRNIFALNSLLERHGMNVITATNGQDAIKLLDEQSRPVADPDGRHDAGDGRLRDHAAHPRDPRVPPAAHHFADRQGHEGRPREMPAGGRFRLRRQAREHRAALVAGAHVAAAVRTDMSTIRHPFRTATTPPTSCWWTTSRRACSPTAPSSSRWDTTWWR